MLISFTLENWMSFRGPMTFSMISGQETHHVNRVPSLESQGFSLLPVATVFGGNASGKSNFVKALDFARKFIVHGTTGAGSIAAKPFRLDDSSTGLPTKFGFKMLIAEKIYDYEFAISSKSVISESLSETNNNVTNLLYRIEHNEIFICTHLNKELLELVAKNRKSNQLLLTSICHVTNYEIAVYQWFRDNFRVIFPETKIDDSYFEYETILDTVNNILKRLDCGVDQVGFVEYTPSETEIAYLKSELEEKDTAYIANKQVFARNLNNKLDVKRFATFHRSVSNQLVMFDLREESDGTVRLFDLLPAFLILSQIERGGVFVIDNIDQSLHTHMIQNLVNAYLNNCSNDSKSQLIFTTHNVELMSLSLLRHDEMRLTERDSKGMSTIYSIADFVDVKPEEDIRYDYLMGRFGGIPEMLLIGKQLHLSRKKIQE